MKKRVVEYLDDLDGEPIVDEPVEVLTFTVGTSTYTLELRPKHVEEFHAAIAPWTKAGRRTSTVDRRVLTRRQATFKTERHANRVANQTTVQLDASDRLAVRQWAAEEGIEAPSRGRLPQALVTQWQEAVG